ncbi:hypothetical protein Trydic_g4353 [Trypoxylus dichotomus]
MRMSDTSYIAALDIGTTTIRCYVINSRAETVGNAVTKTKILYPQSGYVEIEPDDLWNTVISITKEAISNANLGPKDIKCLAITTQRATFITWAKDTGKYLHNFITWKDTRSKDLVEKINNSYLLKTMQSGAHLLYLLGRRDRYLMGSRFKLSTIQCTSRLLWVLQNIPEVRRAADNHNLCFGTIDTWLLHKLTGGTKFLSEVSNASSTGLFDPFIMKWSEIPKLLMGIPKHIYPEVVDSDYDFGGTVPEIFGVPIRIGSIIADQQASMFGSSCFMPKDLKITIGTGSFININTNSEPVASAEGTYPLVAWTLNNISTYLTEASCRDSGSLIQWAMNAGIASEVSKISAQAYSVQDSDGVFFIPAFSGLGPPLSDDQAATGFLGLKPTTTRNHMMRAILESIVYTIVTAYNALHQQNTPELKEISVDGGVSNNDFVCQLLADILERKIIRFASHERTILGASFLAGLNIGVWKNTQDWLELRKILRIFVPDENVKRKEQLVYNMETWLKAVKRFEKWYT